VAESASEHGRSAAIGYALKSPENSDTSSHPRDCHRPSSPAKEITMGEIKRQPRERSEPAIDTELWPERSRPSGRR
jgi:hypothetical protein